MSHRAIRKRLLANEIFPTETFNVSGERKLARPRRREIRGG